MALTNTYILPTNRIPDLFRKIQDGQAPDRFTHQLLKDWGFKSTNDRAFIPLLKALGFLTADGIPTPRYLEYRDHSRSKQILGQAIREALEEKEGLDWQDKLPPKIKEHAESRRETAHKDTWLEGEKADLLGFVDFGQLAQIVIAKWEHFKDVLPTQHWLKQRMDEIEKARNFIAHNRMLLPSEFQRLYMYIADWNRAVGL